MKRYYFFLWLTVFCPLPATATTPTLTTNSIPCPTATNIIPRLKVYPTPDWDKLKRGEDYVPNEVSVMVKKGISEKEEDRVFRKISKFGKVTLVTLSSLNISYYRLIIKNGMSERKVMETLKPDLAVEFTSLDTITHIGRPFKNNENVLNPDKEDLKEFRLR